MVVEVSGNLDVVIRNLMRKRAAARYVEKKRTVSLRSAF